MSNLLRALLHRQNLLLAPAGVETGGGGSAVDGDMLDGPDDSDEQDGGDEEEIDGGDSGEEGQGDASDEPGEVTVSLGGDDEEDEDEADEATITALGDKTSNEAFARMRAAKKDLKRQLLDTARRNRELEEQMQTLRPAEKAIEVGSEPDIDAYEDEYGTLTAEKKAQFKIDHAAWSQRKRDADLQNEKRETAQREQQQQWQNRLQAVDQETAKLGLAGQKEAKQAFDSTFSIVQRGIIMGALEEPKTSALLSYALGRNPAAARKLAAIQDPVKFAVAVGKLETQMKVTSKRGGSVATPDRRVQSGKAGAAISNNQLERLQAEADKTGDRTKVTRYMREQARKDA